MGKQKSLVCGVGVNDYDASVCRTSNSGRSVHCYFYARWKEMLRRCYSESYQKIQPTYAGCKVCPEWLYFTNFRSWMESQDWQGKHLDKDIIVNGNKTYSPETCVFVDAYVNTFTTDIRKSKGGFMTGVSYHKRDKRFVAQCGNPITKKLEYLGGYKSEVEAHLAWKKRKHELACQLADLQGDERVAKALRIRYAS